MAQRHTGRHLLAVVALLLAVSSCDSKGTTTTATTADPACPVTVPTAGDFVPPEPYPVNHPDQGFAWFGSDGLWTVLELGGSSGERKSVWWSENFPGGAEEEQPDLHVTWRRLDDPGASVLDNGGDATNAYTVTEGWFMIGGVDPHEAGCWEVEASYKGATLSYIYLQR